MASKDQKPTVPAGWVAVWDEEYKEWFYVNETSKKSQWEAPQGTRFPQSQGAPPAYETTGRGAQQQPQQQPRYQQQQPMYQQQQPVYSQQPMYQQQQPMYQQQQPMYGQQPMYAQQPMYQQQAKNKQSGGYGKLMGGAALGAVGGLMLGNMFESGEHHYQDQMYADGYQNGYDSGFGDGNDFNGGDFGGGDFGGGDFGGGGDF